MLNVFCALKCSHFSVQSAVTLVSFLMHAPASVRVVSQVLKHCFCSVFDLFVSSLCEHLLRFTDTRFIPVCEHSSVSKIEFDFSLGNTDVHILIRGSRVLCIAFYIETSHNSLTS